MYFKVEFIKSQIHVITEYDISIDIVSAGKQYFLLRYGKCSFKKLKMNCKVNNNLREFPTKHTQWWIKGIFLVKYVCHKHRQEMPDVV
jgi:hypothetical protein